MNNKEIHTSIDFVCDLDNASKILNGNYDETDQEGTIEEEQEEVLPFNTKRAIHREKQKLGRTQEDYLDKERFTEEEIKLLKQANRLDDDGYYITDEELQIGVFELPQEKTRLESA